MKRFKGTPAPWVIDKEHELADEDYHFILSGDGFHRDETNKGFIIADYMSKYDACLIASAPELLEVLIELVQSYDKCSMDHNGLCQEHFLQEANDCTFKKANLAIAKALGEIK